VGNALFDVGVETKVPVAASAALPKVSEAKVVVAAPVTPWPRFVHPPSGWSTAKNG
jgi:hypothetical protein